MESSPGVPGASRGLCSWRRACPTVVSAAPSRTRSANPIDRKTLGYWITTGLFCTALGLSGIAHFTRVEPIAQAMTALGYPLYVMTILGLAKLLGVLALLLPERPLLKEWAYAGFAFNLIAAAASHLMAGEPVAESVPPIVLVGIGAASYLLRPKARRLTASPSLAGARTDAHGR